MYIHTYREREMYIYIYMYTHRERERWTPPLTAPLRKVKGVIAPIIDLGTSAAASRRASRDTGSPTSPTSSIN